MDGKINYDFLRFNRAMAKLKNGETDRATRDLKLELNKFFKDSICSDVIYTKNTDKVFFGMTTYCVFTNSEVDDIVNNNNPMRVQKYMIEIDSKLLDIGLASRELTAVLLHEVGHVVNDSTPIDEVRAAIDKYLAETGATLDVMKTREVNALFKFAIVDTIRKSKSLFTRRDDEILADEFVFRCGYGVDLQRAFNKISSSMYAINKDVDNRFLGLLWTMRIYTDLKINRLSAIRTLNRVAQLSGSALEKREVKDVVKNLNTCNLSVLENAVAVLENADRGKRSLVYRIKRGGLKGIEEDLYEYLMRIRNVETEDEAIVLMRQINARMSILDDYICYTEGLSEQEVKRWQKTLDKYSELRDQLAKKAVYNSKRYGLFVDYNYGQDMYGAEDAYYR